MNTTRTILFVEDLVPLACAVPASLRLPALERVLVRGRRSRPAAECPNHLRYHLFDAPAPASIPVAALTRAARTGVLPPPETCWLRADPVTLRADMTRVFMVSAGFPDDDPDLREAVDRLVRETLGREGIRIPDDEHGPWCFPLEEALSFEFTPLHQALGLDAADALPSGAGSAYWKRLLTDLQVELHQAEFNRVRRESGLPEVNSLWFWGGGVSPEPIEGVFDIVVSDDPVARGLAVASGVQPRPQNEAAGLAGADERLLIDWEVGKGSPVDEARRLDEVLGGLLTDAKAGVRLVCGSGLAWAYDSRSALRVWKRSRPIAELLAGEQG